MERVLNAERERDAVVVWLERLGYGAESRQAGLRHATTGKLSVSTQQ